MPCAPTRPLALHQTCQLLQNRSGGHFIQPFNVGGKEMQQARQISTAVIDLLSMPHLLLNHVCLIAMRSRAVAGGEGYGLVDPVSRHKIASR